MELISSPEACRLAGVTYRQMDYWTREGLVAPAREAQGSGSARRWSVDDVFALRLVKTLLGHGVPRRAIIEAQATAHGAPAHFLWVQGDIVGKGDFWDLQEALDYVPETVVVNLDVIRSDLRDLSLVA